MVTWLEKKSKDNKHTIEVVALIIAICILLFTAYQSLQTKQQIQLSRQAIEFQFKPRVDIEFNSPRISTVITENEYKKADYIQVYKNDFQKLESGGQITNLTTMSIPFNVTIYNWGQAIAKLQRIKYDFSCDSKGERDWQVDILKRRTIPPQEEIYYSNYLHLDFENIPEEMTWCIVKWKFIFNEDVTEEVNYKVLYYNFTSSFVEIERQNSV